MKPTLTLIGHASMKIKTAEGVVIYIDPYYDGDYTEPADIVLSGGGCELCPPVFCIGFSEACSPCPR